MLREQRLLLLHDFVSLRQLLPQNLILFSQINQFFFYRHVLTLLISIWLLLAVCQ